MPLIAAHEQAVAPISRDSRQHPKPFRPRIARSSRLDGLRQPVRRRDLFRRIRQLCRRAQQGWRPEVDARRPCRRDRHDGQFHRRRRLRVRAAAWRHQPGDHPGSAGHHSLPQRPGEGGRRQRRAASHAHRYRRAQGAEDSRVVHRHRRGLAQGRRETRPRRRPDHAQRPVRVSAR